MIVSGLVWFVAASRIACKDSVHVSAGILKQSPLGIEDNHGNLTLAKNAELHSFLHKPILPFRKGDLQHVRVSASWGDLRSWITSEGVCAQYLTIPFVCNLLDTNLLAAHCNTTTARH